MKDMISKKSNENPPENPFHDPLQQELGYKLDARNSGCLLVSFAGGLLVVAVVAFLAYWLTRGR